MKLLRRTLALGLAALGVTVLAFPSAASATPPPDFVRLTSTNLETWNFGTLAQRQVAANWTTIYDRIEQLLVGRSLLLMLVVLALWVGRKQRFWLGLTLAALLPPVVFFNLVLQIIGAFQAFTPAYIISGGKGGPADATLFYTLYLYEQAFTNFQMGYASAMAWVLVAIIGLATVISFKSARYWVHYGDER